MVLLDKQLFLMVYLPCSGLLHVDYEQRWRSVRQDHSQFVSPTKVKFEMLLQCHHSLCYNYLVSSV